MPTVTCPQCQKSGNVPEKVLGQRIVCPACKATFTAVAQAAPPTATQAPAAVVVTGDTPATDPLLSAEEKEDKAIEQAIRKKHEEQSARSVEVVITEDQTSWFSKGLNFGCGFMVAQLLFAAVLVVAWMLFAAAIIGIRH
jgi:hypothetical protein